MASSPRPLRATKPAAKAWSPARRPRGSSRGRLLRRPRRRTCQAGPGPPRCRRRGRGDRPPSASATLRRWPRAGWVQASRSTLGDPGRPPRRRPRPPRTPPPIGSTRSRGWRRCSPRRRLRGRLLRRRARTRGPEAVAAMLQRAPSWSIAMARKGRAPIVTSWRVWSAIASTDVPRSLGSLSPASSRPSLCWRRLWSCPSSCPSTSRASGGPGRACSCSAPLAPARRCWRRPWPRSARRPFSTSPRPRWRASTEATAKNSCGCSSRWPGFTRPPRFSSMRSTPWAASAAATRSTSPRGV
mmetsp:Transcript_60941/g.199526  ORF Transcript_60941/g.199526 Transcript_60941/m.199526 type:complete len:299 (-) Transcript_60941:574-1470(-)